MMTKYRNFVKLLETWPVDKNKAKRDLGPKLKADILAAFKNGELINKADSTKYEEIYKAMRELATNKHKTDFPYSRTHGMTKFSLETLRVSSSDETIELINKNPTFMQGLIRRFGAKAEPTEQSNDKRII